MTTTIKTRTAKTGLGLLAAFGIALAGLAALPAGDAAARPCQMPREPGEERPICGIARAPQSADLDRSGEEIPTRRPLQFGGLSGGIEGTNEVPLFGGLSGGIEGGSRTIVIPQ